MIQEGKVKRNDGKDIDHIVPLSEGGGTGLANLRVRSAHANRSYPRNPDGSMKRTKK